MMCVTFIPTKSMQLLDCSTESKSCMEDMFLKHPVNIEVPTPFLQYVFQGNLVNSAHFNVGPLETRPIQTISLIKVIGLNKVSRKLFNFYATFLLIKCCKETPRNSVNLYFYV